MFDMEELKSTTKEEIPLDMYKIPGQSADIKSVYDDYIKSKESVGEKIKQLHIKSPDYLRLQITNADYNERASLLSKGLEISNIKTVRVCAGMIRYVPKEERASLLSKGLESEDAETVRICARMIRYIPDNEKASLFSKLKMKIDKGLESGDTETMRICAETIIYVPDNEKASLLSKGLESEDAETVRICAGMIIYVPENEKASLVGKLKMKIGKGLESGDTETMRICARMIGYVPKNEKSVLFNLAKEKAGDILIEPPLYRNISTGSRDKFSKEKFKKSGSETTLLGAGLRNRLIIRRITPASFLTWQKAYEDYPMWQRYGFDYVPIEPIQKFRLNKEGLVDVFSGVLDCNLGYWEKIGGNFTAELIREKRKIEDVLKENNIEHGHAHEENFCLRFYRDEKGQVDFSVKPRIYLIDFDSATSN